MFWFDRYYLILVLPTVLLALAAQALVNSTYNRYSRVPVQRGISGREVAEMILNAAGIFDVPVQMVQGTLTDHYDPSAKVLRLSENVYNGRSIAAVGVAAHECGHAIQHQQGYAPLQIRNAIIPATRIGSRLSMPLIILGIIVSGATNYTRGTDFGWYVIMAGIALFSLSVIFQLLTLPVEFNASRRALQILGGGMYLSQDELSGARKVLTAAALTYVAALAQSLASLLRLLLIFGGGRRRD